MVPHLIVLLYNPHMKKAKCYCGCMHAYSVRVTKLIFPGLITAPTLSFPEECQAMKPSIEEAIAILQR